MVTPRCHHVVVVQGHIASVWIFSNLAFEALFLQFIMPHQLIGTAVIGITLVQNVLTDLLETFSYIRIELEELVHDCVVDLVVLVIDLLLVDVMQVDG